MKILKALFVPNNKGKRCSFPTTKCSVVRLIVSYSRTFHKLKKLFVGFLQYHEDFDYAEIDRMIGI